MTIEQLNDTAQSFLGWQCRLRQYAVRRGDGRPSAGMCPRVTLNSGRDLGTIVTVLVKIDVDPQIQQFRYIVKQTLDPRARYEAAIKTLQTVYYQYPGEFSENFTALFNVESSLAAALEAEPLCTLDFEQANQRYSLPCRAVATDRSDPFHAATFWHNAMFNAHLSEPVRVLKFCPDWTLAVAQTT